MFTKNHYKSIAELIAKNTTINGDIDKELLIEDLSQLFLSDNPLFNPVLFEKACYPFRE